MQRTSLVSVMLLAVGVVFSVTGCAGPPIVVTSAPNAKILVDDILGAWHGSQAALPKSETDTTGSYGFATYRFMEREDGRVSAEILHYYSRDRDRLYTSARVTALRFEDNSVQITAHYFLKGTRYNVTYELALDRENDTLKGSGYVSVRRRHQLQAEAAERSALQFHGSSSSTRLIG